MGGVWGDGELTYQVVMKKGLWLYGSGVGLAEDSELKASDLQGPAAPGGHEGISVVSRAAQDGV